MSHRYKIILIATLFLLCIGCGAGTDEERRSSISSVQSSSLLLTPSHTGWGLRDCKACHPLSVIHRDRGVIKDMVSVKGFTTCMGCHGDNGTDGERRCTVCHNKNDMPLKPYQHGGHVHGFSGDNGLEDSECIICHDSSNMNGVFTPYNDLTIFMDEHGTYSEYTSIFEFCLRCHNRYHQQPGFEITGYEYTNPLVAMEDNYRFIDRHGTVDGTGDGIYRGLREGYEYGTSLECTECHNVHGTTNPFLLIDSTVAGVRGLDSSIRLRPYSIEIDGGNLSQLCVICHKMDTVLDDGDRDTGNGLSGVHYVESDCTDCHTHGAGL